jgi:hypothetical protein
MGVLKKKEERSQTITIRIPSSVKAEIDQLRDRAEATGFDLNATMSESLTRLVKQIREELDGIGALAVFGKISRCHWIWTRTRLCPKLAALRCEPISLLPCGMRSDLRLRCRKCSD